MILTRQPRRSLGFSLGPTAAGGATGALAYTNPVSGAVAAGVSIASNLLSCGTIDQTGCNKRSDAQLQIVGTEKMRQAAYAAETGQLDPQTAIAQISQLAQAVQNGYINKASGNSFTQDACGPESGIPATSKSGALLCGQTVSLAGFAQALQQLVASFQGAGVPTALPATFVTSPAVPAQMLQTTPPNMAYPKQPSATGTNLTTIALLAAAGAFVFLAMK